MREDHPVCSLNTPGMWALSRYDDVKFAMERTDLFSASGQKALIQPDWLPDDLKKDLFIAVQDPPEHTKNRALLTRAFAGKMINALIPFMQEIAENQVARVKQAGRVEFLNGCARPYVCEISDRMTGADSGTYLAELGRWLKLNQENLSENPPPEYMKALQANMARQNAIFDAIIHDRRQNPQEDIATDLIRGRVDGRALTDEQLRNALELVITAGFFTPTQMLCQAVIYLARNPGLMQGLKANPDLIPAFFEELMRHVAIVRALLKRTRHPVTLHGTTIPEGALVFLLLASANHDPARFHDPDRFDMTRPNIKQHLGFGHGPHICIGAALARQQMRIILEVLIATFNGIDVPPATDIRMASSWVMNVVEELPVTFH